MDFYTAQLMFMKIIVEGAIQLTKSISGKACSPTKCDILIIHKPKKCFSITMKDTHASIWEPVSFYK